MQFKHCGVHQGQFGVLLYTEEPPPDPAPVPIVVGCSGCHQWYFCDTDPAEEPAVLEAMLVRAEARLLAECPDHPHRFEIDRFQINGDQDR